MNSSQSAVSALCLFSVLKFYTVTVIFSTKFGEKNNVLVFGTKYGVVDEDISFEPL